MTSIATQGMLLAKHVLRIQPDIIKPSLILSALERRFPPSAGYPTLFPRGKHGGNPDTGIVRAFSKYFLDHTFALAALLLPWDKLPAAFIEDRNTVSFVLSPQLVSFLKKELHSVHGRPTRYQGHQS
jgi:hypothetical protein